MEPMFTKDELAMLRIYTDANGFDADATKFVTERIESRTSLRFTA